MKNRHILSASILFLGLSQLSYGDLDSFPAQPVTLSAAVGDEQSDFFFTQTFGGYYVAFTGVSPLKGKAGLTKEARSLFTVKISDGINNYFTTVTKASPLKKVSTFKVAKGTVFDSFSNALLNATTTNREIFHVPGLGVYMTTSGKHPSLLRAESATAPITGVAVRYPENSPKDLSDPTQQFRVIIGAKDKKKGLEPFQSSGTGPSTKLLKDIVAGANGSNAQQFITAADEVYFAATDPASDPAAPALGVYYVTASAGSKSPTYSAAELPGSAVDSLSNLTGGAAGLFYTGTLSAGHTTIYRYYPGLQGFYGIISTDDQPQSPLDPTQLTPAVGNGDTMAFSALDPLTNKVRFGVYSFTNDAFQYPEVDNTTVGTTTNPTHITSAGSYYYFDALYANTGPYFARNFTGSSSIEYVGALTKGNLISNVQEITSVPIENGNIYFTGDGFVDNANQTGILFTMDPENADPVAVPVRTIGGALVRGAHNLRAVINGGQVFRCYFTAPVTGTTNSEYATGGKDYGTKPWVVNAP